MGKMRAKRPAKTRSFPVVDHFPLKFERLSLVFQGSIDREPYGCEISKVLSPMRQARRLSTPKRPPG